MVSAAASTRIGTSLASSGGVKDTLVVPNELIGVLQNQPQTPVLVNDPKHCVHYIRALPGLVYELRTLPAPRAYLFIREKYLQLTPATIPSVGLTSHG